MKLMLLRLFLILMLVVTGSAASSQAAEDDAAKEAHFLSRVRQLTFEGKRSGEGYFSADGKALVFQSEREPGNPFYQIYLLDLETGDSHRVSPGHGKTTCAFIRPGSDEVLFASSHKDPAARDKQTAELDFRASGKQRRYSWDYEEAMNIAVAKRDGSGLRQLTTAYGYDAEGAYSPDGSKIVFCSMRDAYPEENLSDKERQTLRINPSYFGEIYIMNADGSDQTRLTKKPGYDGGPFFSPDGKRIIWRRFNEKGTLADVYTMKLDGSDVKRLTDFKAMSWAPYFHPSGRYAIFASNKLGFDNFELFLVDAEGSKEPVRVTHTDGFDGLPVFSPDGESLCWTATRTSNKKSQLFMGKWDHAVAIGALGLAPDRQESESAVSAMVPAIAEDDLKAHVGYLASDKLEGRETGKPGALKAAEYIAKQLQLAGIEPFGDDDTFFHKFEFNAGAKIVQEQNSLRVSLHVKDRVPVSTGFEVEKGFRPLAFSANGEVEGEVVFGGYGLAMPQEDGGLSDPYGGVNVSNKVVMVLRYAPENVEPKRKAELNRYAGLYYKAKIAQQRGAKAVLFVTGPNSPNAGKLFGMSGDSSLGGMIAASITDEVAAELLGPTERPLKGLQAALDGEDPHAPSGMEIKGVSIKLKIGIERIRGTDRNVLGILLPGSGDPHAEYVLVGAHYDHLGLGREGNSRAGKDELGQIHNGADDNASGCATLLELAANLAELRKKNPKAFTRGVIFGFWSGEEMGLIGSARYAEKPNIPHQFVSAYLNFDMVGRMRDNKLILQGVGSSTGWKRLIEKANVAAGFDLKLQEDPYLPTDATSFYPKQIPVLAFFTGSHEDYHRPTDDADTLNYEGIERVTKFARTIVRDLVKPGARPEWAKVDRSSKPSVSGLRVYLGTIPDYAAEVVGVKLTGVRGGAPADKAGLKGGDVIVEFGGIPVKNIEDYMVAFNAVKVDTPTKIVVMRDGKRTELTIIPEGK
jgi:Tol biopolymer transport system component